MLLSGSVMIDLLGVWPLRARTGATFVHDWVALGIFLLVAGHLWYALRDPEALRGVTSGTVSEEWARRDHGAWLDAPGCRRGGRRVSRCCAARWRCR